MPQTFQVLRCFKCLVFQVHQTKKSSKWECKMCGEKQSIKRHYGIGTGKDCRVHVQKLNCLRGEIDEFKCSQMRRNVDSDEEEDVETNIQNIEPQPAPQTLLTKDSKWSNYVDESEISEDQKEPMRLGDAEVVLEIPKKRRKQIQNYCNNYKISKCYTKTKTSVLQNIDSNSEVDIKLSCSGYKAPAFKTSNSKTTPNNNFKLDTLPQNLNNTLEAEVTTLTFPESQLKEKENFKPKVPVKKFVPPVINKNSKWAQFAEEEERDISIPPSLGASQNDLKFSLCDDDDLDNVLDI